MANILYDLVNPAVLTDYVRAYDNEVLVNQFVLGQFLPDKPIMDLEYRIAQQDFLDVDTAEYRAFDTQPGFTHRQGTAVIKGEIPPLGQSIPLTEEERLRLRALTGPTQMEDSMDPIIAAIYADAERVTRAIKARLELARGSVLSTGKLTLAENGMIMEADFGIPSGNVRTAAKVWSDVTATILTELLAWQEVYVGVNGFAPGYILTNRTVAGYMFLNNELRAAASANNTTPARINMEVIDAILAAHGLPPISIYDTLVRVNGVQTRVIPLDTLLMLPPAGIPLGGTFYGVTAEAMLLRQKGLIISEDMPGIVCFNTMNDQPVQTFTTSAAIAMPVLGAPQSVLTATIL